MATQNKSTVALPNDRDVVVTRAFNAPRSLVYDAYTKPELVSRWLLGPPGWTMPVCEMDLRVGGKFRCTRPIRSEKASGDLGLGGNRFSLVDQPSRTLGLDLGELIAIDGDLGGVVAR